MLQAEAGEAVTRRPAVVDWPSKGFLCWRFLFFFIFFATQLKHIWVKFKLYLIFLKTSKKKIYQKSIKIASYQLKSWTSQVFCVRKPRGLDDFLDVGGQDIGNGNKHIISTTSWWWNCFSRDFSSQQKSPQQKLIPRSSLSRIQSNPPEGNHAGHQSSLRFPQAPNLQLRSCAHHLQAR